MDDTIRTTAIGERNWLLIVHPSAGQRSVTICSLVLSCQHHDKDRMAYDDDAHRHDYKPARWHSARRILVAQPSGFMTARTFACKGFVGGIILPVDGSTAEAV